MMDELVKKTLPVNPQLADAVARAKGAAAANGVARGQNMTPGTPRGPIAGSMLPSQAADRAREALAAAMQSRSMTPMVPGSSIMPNGRAYAKGGMVGCGWSPKSGATMRGAARKGK